MLGCPPRRPQKIILSHWPLWLRPLVLTRTCSNGLIEILYVHIRESVSRSQCLVLADKLTYSRCGCLVFEASLSCPSSHTVAPMQGDLGWHGLRLQSLQARFTDCLRTLTPAGLVRACTWMVRCRLDNRDATAYIHIHERSLIPAACSQLLPPNHPAPSVHRYAHRRCSHRPT